MSIPQECVFLGEIVHSKLPDKISQKTTRKKCGSFKAVVGAVLNEVGVKAGVVWIKEIFVLFAK